LLRAARALPYPLLVGGRTALELQGYAHYLTQDLKEVHLYGPKPPPQWLHKLKAHHQPLGRHRPRMRTIQ